MPSVLGDLYEILGLCKDSRLSSAFSGQNADPQVREIDS